jgi:predicted nucleotidyltransferase
MGSPEGSFMILTRKGILAKLQGNRERLLYREVRPLGIFRSYQHDEASERSDFGFLVEPEDPT